MSKPMTLAGTNPLIEARNAPDITGTEVVNPKATVPLGIQPTGAPKYIAPTTAEQNPDAIQPEEASHLASIGAGMGGIALNVYRASRSALIYDRDPNFNHELLAEHFFLTEGAGTPEEVKYLAAAKNENDFNDRTEYIRDDRMRKAAIADNPISGMVGSLADVDLAVGFVKIAKVGKAATTAERATERASAAAIGAGGMYGVNKAIGDDTLRTDGELMGDVITMGLARAVAPMTKSANPATQSIANQINQSLNIPAPTGTPAQQVMGNKYISQLQSTADELRFYTQGDDSTVVNKLLSNPAINNGDDVVSAQNVFLNNYGHRVMEFEDVLKDTVAVMSGVRGNFINRVTGKYSAAYKEVSADFQVALQRLDSEVIDFHKANGTLPTRDEMTTMMDNLGIDPRMQKAIHSYTDSGIATKVYDDAYDAQLFMRETVDANGNIVKSNGLDDVLRRPTYMPLRHSYDKIEHTVMTRGVATMDEVAEFVGQQIVRMYPDLLNPKGKGQGFKLTTGQVGKHFLQTQADSARSLGDVAATGMNREQIADILTRTGNFTDKEAVLIADNIHSGIHSSGTSVPKNLRRRIDWDWNASLRTSKGHNLTMRDLVDDNVMGNLEDYTRTMAHKNGLAQYGIKSDSELENLLESYLSKLPTGVNIQQARQFMRNTKDTLLGRPIEKNPLPEGIRSAQSIADMFLLANSGLYGIMDLATQMQKVGVLRSLPHFKAAMKPMFKSLKSFKASEAKELEDILTGRLLQGSRWKNFQVRYADNFEVTSGIHEAAQYYGQSARFMNLSETLKRFQVGVLSGVYVNNLKKAMKGDAAELKFMVDKLKFDAGTIKEIQAEYAKHGTKIDDWANKVRVKYEQKIFHDADNLAMNVHRGEVPSFIEHSAVGRVIFPYMRYAFGMQNKVLRRTMNRDGATGLAMLLALQIPTGMLIGSAINIRTGKDPEDNLEVMTIKGMSALGSLNYPLEIAMAGLDGGGVTALAPFGKSYNFAKELATGGGDGKTTASQLIKNSPLNAAVVLDYLALGLED